MLDAYAIAVKISLINKITPALAGIASDLKKTEGAADGLHKKLGLIGLAMAGTGAAMLAGLKGPLQAAMDFNRELAKLKQQGLGDLQIADAQKFVEANAIMGTSLQQRMKLFVEAQGAFRESGMGGLKALEAAKVMSPVLAQYQVAGSLLNGPHKGAVESSMMSLNKTVEMMGGLGDVDRATAIADGVFKAVQSSGKMVNEHQLKQFVAYASSAGNQQNLRTIFAGLEPIIGELGGSTTAVGLRTAYTRTNGMMSLPPQLLLQEMQRLGMTDATGRKQNSTLAGLQSTDAIGYAAEIMKRYDAAGIKTQTDRERENAIIFGTNGSKVFNKIMSQMPVIQHSMDAYDQAQTPKQVIKGNANSPMMAFDKFHKALEDLGLVIGQTVLPVLTPMVQGLTGLFTTLKDFPGMVKGLTLGFAGLGTALAIGGTLGVVSTAFTAMSGAVGLIGGAGGVLALGAASPIVLGIGALGAALAGMSWLLDFLKPESKDKMPAAAIPRSNGSPAEQEWVPGTGRGGVGGHWELKKSILPGTGPSNFIRGSSPMRQQAINNTIVMPDGRVLAKVVSEVQSRQMALPPTGGRTFDGSIAPRPVGGN